MKKETIKRVEKRLREMIPEAMTKIEGLRVNEDKDRVRIIFEFGFEYKKINDTLEVRHRRE